MAMRLRLDTGLEVLEEWSRSASQAERNIVYEALFSVSDGSAFMIYDVFGDGRNPPNFIISVVPELVLRIYLRRVESVFGVLYVGAPEIGRPEGGDLHQGTDAP